MTGRLPTANDLRVLRFAALHESAYKRHIVVSAMPLVRDAHTREALQALLPVSETHSRRIERELARLHAAAGVESADDAERAAIMDIEEAGRAARTEFLASADRVHDQRLAQLFRELAEDEEQHVRVAERALADLEARRRADAAREDQA